MRVDVNENGSKTWHFHNGETLPNDEIVLNGNKYVPKEGELAINSDDLTVKSFNGTQWK